MKVTLTRITEGPILAIEEAASNCYNSEATGDGKIMNHCIKSGHTSVTEFCDFTFHIEGISRALSHQLVRHRMASYAQRSQRYCSEDGFEYITPHSIKTDADAWREFCLNMTRQLYGHCASIRSNGSAETELCYLAAGKIDVYFESFIQPWDVAAGACILKEAGGKITDYAGRDDMWESGQQVIATNGLLHEAMLKEIQKDRFS